MSTTNQSHQDPVVDPAAFNQYADNLHDEKHLFQCHRCGHYAGDSRSHNFRSRCPGCERLSKFWRIID